MRAPVRVVTGVVAALAVAASLAACSSDDGDASGDADLVIYTGRSEEQVGDLIDRFEEDQDVTVDVRYGDTAELAVQLLEEGDDSPADLFWAQDAGALSAVDEEGMFSTLPKGVLAKVPEEYQSRDGAWVGTSGRARVFAYNPTLVPQSELPESVFDLTEPEWANRVAIAPTNGSFQAFVTAMREAEGDDVAEQWLTDMKANGAVAYESNVLILDAVDAGEIDLGLINHYYWYQKAAEVGEDQVTAEIDFFEPGDPGSLVNVAGAGVLTSGEDNPLATEFVKFLLSPESQEYFVEVDKEYPLIDGVAPQEGLPPLAELQGPQVELYELADLEGTLQMLTETGWI
ncbi:MAG TPA: iron ABC transporter substrate-binding protein [Actinomycetes bacterium]|nr:iron ABC transporter substrate-binding protein [Actinomycetes bacterium]